MFKKLFKKILSNAKSPRISVLRLSGIIGKLGMGKNGMTLEALNDNIEKAFSKPKTKAVCLIINSPGGSPVQSELIANRIIALSKEKKIPVYAFVEDVAASGGYWLACAADEIYASTSSIMGSIGVISAGFGFQDMIKKMGIERRVVTQGENKSVLDPFKPTKKEDIEILKNLQKNTHDHFINYVKSRREKRLKGTDKKLFNGEFWNGQTSLELGLVDGIDNLYNFIQNKFGKKAKIEYIKSRESWFKRKFLSSIDVDSIIDGIHSKCEEESVGARFRLY
jgi:signal peptide peptidase SppA